MSQIEITYLHHCGDDLTVSNAARVSFGKNRPEFLYDGDPRIRPSGRSDESLIKDLAKEGHFAPFGHCYAAFHIKAPIFVARQLVKHKFLRWSEISLRYVTNEPEIYIPNDWRSKPDSKKQGSGDSVVNLEEYSLWGDSAKGIDYEDSLLAFLYDTQRESCVLYNDLLEVGVAPEQARMVLPLSVMTEWWWSGSMDAFANMCKLRLKNDTQEETRVVAQGIDKHMLNLYPVSWKALLED